MNSLQTVSGVSVHDGAVVNALQELRSKGYRNLQTYSPIPNDALLEEETNPPSPIRYYTLTGGLLGAVTGLAFPSWTVLNWPLITGGKPLISIPAFLIISFELTILLGGLFTLAGLVIHGPMGRAPAGEASGATYDPRCGDDRYGIVVSCEAAQVEEVKQLLSAAGMEETSVAS